MKKTKMRTVCGTILAAGLAACSLHAAEPSATAFVSVDVAKEIGSVKPMHAVNNGPSVKSRAGTRRTAISRTTRRCESHLRGRTTR